MRNKNFLWIIISLIAFILIVIFVINQRSNDFVEDYQNAFSLIKEGNQYVMEEDADDSCYPYRVSNRGCAYDKGKGYLTISSLQNYNLTNEERINLCYEFAHGGAVAYCLTMNDEKQKCYDLAEDNVYLNRICNLEEGEIISSQKFGPYPADDSIEPVLYSELI